MTVDPPILDRSVIDELGALNPGDTELVKSIVMLYEQDGVTRIAELEAARLGGDVEAASEAAHSLKGASRTIGALRMGDVCERLEKLGALPTEMDLEEARSIFAETCRALVQLVRP